MKTFAVRLTPNEDLKYSLTNFVQEHKIQSGFILTAVGSLKQASLRFADHNESQVFSQKFEIVSLMGTLSLQGLHLHICLADSNGKTIGGHLTDGCIIYTTAEIVIGNSEDFIFTRKIDKETGYKELEIQPKIDLG